MKEVLMLHASEYNDVVRIYALPGLTTERCNAYELLLLSSFNNTVGKTLGTNICS